MKIYIHNYFSNTIFNIIAQNTTDRVYNIVNEIGEVTCKYKETNIVLIFNPEINDNKDGYHLIDIFDISLHSTKYSDFKHIPIHNVNYAFQTNLVVKFLNHLYSLIKTKKDWIILNINGEKQFFEYENILTNSDMVSIDNCYKQFKNHKIITDNVFINDYIESKYKNFYFVFTNTIMYWNTHVGIRYYYEFKNIYDNLMFEYGIGYSVRKFKDHRINLLNDLKKLNNKNLYLQYYDAITDYDYSLNEFEKKSIILSNNNIPLNSKKGNTDFENLNNTSYHKSDRIGLDLFFRLLPKSKMQILDEAWAFVDNELISSHLSEKTIGLILAGIPFISTHEYPLDILQKLFRLKPHPFYKEIKECRIDRKKFPLFIETFLNNFDENYDKCKEWTNQHHNLFIDRIQNENSLFDFIFNDFKKENINIDKSII